MFYSLQHNEYGYVTNVPDATGDVWPVCPVSPVEGSLMVENDYDHRHRRIRKIVKRYDGSDWQTNETHTFVWDDMNIVLEKIAFADGEISGDCPRRREQECEVSKKG